MSTINEMEKSIRFTDKSYKIESSGKAIIPDNHFIALRAEFYSLCKKESQSKFK